MTKWDLNKRIKELEEKCRREYERGYNDGTRDAIIRGEKIYKLRIDNLVKEFRKEKRELETRIKETDDCEPIRWMFHD